MADIDWSAVAVPQCHKLQPYVPGKPIEKLLAEKGIASAVKLASNENPFGPSPKAVAAVYGAAHQIHRYPDGDGTELRQALAERHGITADQILLGNGSNELLELIIRCFAGAGDEVVYARRGFIIYALAAAAAGATAIAVPEVDGFAPDLDAMAAAVTGRTKVLCLANPNNPTGSLHALPQLQAFLERLPRQLIVILDEAYCEYVADDIGDSMRNLSHPGLIICRTFSKAYGLAGLRMGYGVGGAAVLALINRFRQPFNVNFLAQIAAVAALKDETWLADVIERTLAGRDQLEQCLQDRGLLAAHSAGNFVLLKHAHADRLLLKLEDHGMIPRPLTAYGMADILRVTVGSEAENAQFCQTLDRALEELPA